MAKKPEYTEQQCIDIAVMIGLTKTDGKLYFLRYSAQDWLNGVGNPITNVMSHMRLLKLTGGLPKMKDSEEKKKKLPQFFGKVCGKCGMPARHKNSGDFGDHYYCIDHIPSKTRQKYIEQGYDLE